MLPISSIATSLLTLTASVISANPLPIEPTELVERQEPKGDIDAVRQVIGTPYEGPTNKSKWLGSLAVRPCGSILLTDTLAPTVYIVEDPKAESPPLEVVTTIPGANALTGITETEPDVYQVVAGGFSIKNESAVPGTLKLWSIDYSTGASKPVVRKTADLDRVTMLNGLTYLGHDIVLGSDSIDGAIVTINTKTGGYHQVWKSASLTAKDKASKNSSTLGVNGIKVAREGPKTYLYFTVTAKSILAKIEINPTTGEPMPGATIMTIETTLGEKKGVGYDGFAMRIDATADLDFYAADSRGNAIEHISGRAGGVSQEIVAGNINSTEVAEPSDAAFGRTECDKDILYVCTAGGIFKGIGPENKKVGGQLLAIDTAKH
ncbi:MAG: hypothetical protein M1828_007297 [Chrysothrix sp. TS-e1954]|nr:MAG: hypothetical protein M1828_007297 [Chrysothrix sp. TS-e1954]